MRSLVGLSNWGIHPSANRAIRRRTFSRSGLVSERGPIAATAEPDGTGRCIGHGAQPDVGDRVVVTREGEGLLAQEPTKHGDLLLNHLTACLEGNAERLVFELVPTGADPEAEASPAQDIETGGLLGDQRPSGAAAGSRSL